MLYKNIKLVVETLGENGSIIVQTASPHLRFGKNKRSDRMRRRLPRGTDGDSVEFQNDTVNNKGAGDRVLTARFNDS